MAGGVEASPANPVDSETKQHRPTWQVYTDISGAGPDCPFSDARLRVKFLIFFKFYLTTLIGFI